MGMKKIVTISAVFALTVACATSKPAPIPAQQAKAACPYVGTYNMVSTRHKESPGTCETASDTAANPATVKLKAGKLWLEIEGMGAACELKVLDECRGYSRCEYPNGDTTVTVSTKLTFVPDGFAGMMLVEVKSADGSCNALFNEVAPRVLAKGSVSL